jgi:hypothetical protein
LPNDVNFHEKLKNNIQLHVIPIGSE